MTSTRDARRRTIRTAVQAAVSAAGVLLVALPIVMATVEEHLPAERYAALAGVAAAITAGATLVTRIMALPAVIGFIDTYLPWLSASEPPPHAADGDVPDADR
ncbi:hypothetical protein [Paractinoplanes rishiriensis]|uniref:hypothetical protein n=1 Tax=Paractinoplanes rishiriensis TaxID=1050105 RepID=UPI001EF39808|nr:hypothetical protein [Actinoplanes rishiriensis]